MASSSSYEDEGLFEGVNQINPFEILGISPRALFADARKQFHKLMLIHHSDKSGGDDSFTKLLNQAWELLKNTEKDRDKWDQIAKQFYTPEELKATSPSPENIDLDLDKVLIDKSTSTEFRELFQNILKQKDGLQFKGNFLFFYGQIFDQVQVPEFATSKWKPKFHCEICDGEKFLSEEDHSKVVLYPYYNFVMEPGAQKRSGLEKYLTNLFGEEAVGLGTNSVQSGDFTSDDTVQHFRKMIESTQQRTSSTEPLIQMYSDLCKKSNTQAAKFLLPLILIFKERREFNQAFKVLSFLLPKSMYFRGMQELCAYLLETVDGFPFYKCEAISDSVLTEVERICKGTLLEKVPDIEGEEENGILSLETDHRLIALNALPGALHVLRRSPNQKNHTDPRGIFERLLNPLLTQALDRKQFELIFTLAQCPTMIGKIEKVLSKNKMLQPCEGGIDRKFPPRRYFVSGLLLLRAIYNFKENRISDMLIDLDKANLLAVGHSKLMKSIVSFIVTTPIVHEKIAYMITQQFLELRTYFKKDHRTFVEKYMTRDILSDECHTGLLSDHFDIWTTKADTERKNQGHPFDIIEKKMLRNGDPPEEVAMNYLDLAKMVPGEAAVISCYTQAIAYFYKAMQSSGNITMKYAYMQLIEKVCEMLKPHSRASSSEYDNAYYSLYVLRTKLSFLLRAHFHLDHVIRKFNEPTNVSEIFRKFVSKPNNFSCGSDEKIPDLVDEWQRFLNLRLLCPLSTTEIYSCVDGDLNLRLGSKLNEKIFLEKLNYGGNLENLKLPTHNPERKVEFSNDPARLMDIFKEKPGHFPKDTPQAREELAKLVNKEKNYKGTDVYGRRWFSKTKRNGEQLWAFTLNNVLWDGGINKAGETYEFHLTTGMCAKEKAKSNGK